MQDFIFKWMDDGSYCVMSYEGDEAEVVIPESYCGSPVTALGDGLFKGHTEITSVKIPEGITDMGEFLFDGCTGLRHIDLPSTVRTLWGYTFVRSSFEEVILPDGIVSLPPFAFKDCKQLKRVVCGKGLTRIYNWVFAGCDALKEVDYGGNVKVSHEAFASKVLNT